MDIQRARVIALDLGSVPYLNNLYSLVISSMRAISCAARERRVCFSIVFTAENT